jgi:hypothetical protein
MKYVYIALIGFAALAVPAAGTPIAIPVNCDGLVVGNINVQNNDTSITGNFNTVPGAGSLGLAAAACGETQFNWYQVVTANTFAVNNFASQALVVPWVDPPPMGLAVAVDKTWADLLPWYYDMGTPPTADMLKANGQVLDPGMSLAMNTTVTALNYVDTVNLPPGNSASFSTWLVSLNANGSFNAFDGGFSWTYTDAANGVVTFGQPVSLGGVNPTAAQYQNIIGGFQTALPEPSTLTMVVGGLAFVAMLRRRRK